MSIDLFRLLNFTIIILCALILVVLERVRPYNKGQKFFREGFFNDFILYNFVQSFILGIIISYLVQFLDSVSGLPGYMLLASWPIWLQVLFFVITHDIYIYWFHRLQHRNKFLWRIHEAHHSTGDVDWLSGVRSHSLEILINQTIEFAPIVLLGAAPETAVLKGTISAVWGMYIHSNIDVRSGVLQYFINGPEMHRWHHSNDNKNAYNKNFSTKFAIWDWLFGTAFFPRDIKAQKFGLGGSDFPRSYIKQQAFAFRKFRKS
jgi:sterol desaturase/sphingolipid hydroxylase (fatty acid hydroxylase superfamily)